MGRRSPLTVAGAAAALRAPTSTLRARTAFPFDPLREPPSSGLHAGEMASIVGGASTVRRRRRVAFAPHRGRRTGSTVWHRAGEAIMRHWTTGSRRFGLSAETLMQRVTVTLDDELMADLDRIIAARGYQNRSEAIRDLARAGIREAAHETGRKGECVAALVYVYDHAARELSKRLVQNFHGHHEMSLATLHVHLDNDSCMEVTVLKGGAREVQHLADHIIAERGVRHGRIVMIPSESGAG